MPHVNFAANPKHKRSQYFPRDKLIFGGTPSPCDVVGLQVSPIPCTLQNYVPPDIQKMQDLLPRTFGIPGAMKDCADRFLKRQRTLESLQSRADRENRATIFATLGCGRVRWKSRTRMGNAGARESDSYCKGWATLGASIPSVCLPTAGSFVRSWSR